MRNIGDVTVLLAIITLIGCVSSPYFDNGRSPLNESEYRRVREELHFFRERVAHQTEDERTYDDNTLDHIADAATVQDIDPMLDDDMRIVLEARNVVENRNIGGTLSQRDWIAHLRTEVRIATNNVASVEPAERPAFRNPDSVSETAWCAWYIKDGKRRELVIDHSTRDINQSYDWSPIR